MDSIYIRGHSVLAENSSTVRMASVASVAPATGIEVVALRRTLDEPEGIEAGARFVVERLVLALKTAILPGTASDAVATAFCRSRLRGQRGLALGTSLADVPFDVPIEHAWPA
jgi:putative acyl-CoA dehydrogenase